jgi:DNA helicase HerA-like ATPase
MDKIPPFMLVVEEAHNFCPERGFEKAISSNIMRTIASEGRKFGLGMMVISQRPARVDKNVISQCNTQIILRVTNVQA